MSDFVNTIVVGLGWMAFVLTLIVVGVLIYAYTRPDTRIEEPGFAAWPVDKVVRDADGNVIGMCGSEFGFVSAEDAIKQIDQRDTTYAVQAQGHRRNVRVVRDGSSPRLIVPLGEENALDDLGDCIPNPRVIDGVGKNEAGDVVSVCGGFGEASIETVMQEIAEQGAIYHGRGYEDSEHPRHLRVTRNSYNEPSLDGLYYLVDLPPC